MAKKKWLRTEAVCERYGDVVPRSIERAVKDGRLPAPEYPLGNKIPFWDRPPRRANTPLSNRATCGCPGCKRLKTGTWEGPVI
jgi:hypothetical protein